MGDVMERSAETDSCKGKPRSALTQQSETSQFTFFKDRLDCSCTDGCTRSVLSRGLSQEAAAVQVRGGEVWNRAVEAVGLRRDS